MRSISTNYLVDENKPLIQELYFARMEQNLQRAVQEIRMYHLPVQIPQKYNPPQIAEYSLMSENSTKIIHRAECQMCLSTRPLYGQHTLMCLECWSRFIAALWKDYPVSVNSFIQIINSPAYVPEPLQFILKEDWTKRIMAATLKELVACARHQLHEYPHREKEIQYGWTSPKKALMAMEYGCKGCGYKYPYKDSWLWSADLSDWRNGFCPKCTDLDTGFASMWNLSSREYADWQDSYAVPSKLHRTAARYGTISLLLVSAHHLWVRFIVTTMPNSPNNMILYKEQSRLGNIHRTTGLKAKSLSDLNLKIEDHLPKRSLY